MLSDFRARSSISSSGTSKRADISSRNAPVPAAHFLFILKSTALFFVQLWIRWTLPRVRIDQVLYACVQVLLPMGMLVLLCNTLWILGVRHYQWTWLVAIDAVLSWVLVAIGVIVALGCLGLAAYGFVHRRKLVGRLGIDSLPGA